jgi:hypothetical protein
MIRLGVALERFSFLDRERIASFLDGRPQFQALWPVDVCVAKKEFPMFLTSFVWRLILPLERQRG